MREQTYLAVSKELAQILTESPKDIADDLINRLGYITMEMKMRLAKDKKATIFHIFEAMDRAVIEENIPPQCSCSKGCSHCCSMNVDISDAEAEVIGEYAKKNNIPISKEYLREQLKYSRDDVSVSNVCKCVFLKDGVCSIYPVRPFKCRKYYVVTPPEQCIIKKPFGQVAVKIVIGAELVLCAYASVTREEGRRLPKQLLPYAK